MQLKMWRPADEPLPPVNVPEGFTLRAMREGEEAAWARCCEGEFGIAEASAEAFYRKSMHEISRERIFYICKDDVPVATATAQVSDGEPYLHYIAVHPDWRGHKLAKPLIAHVLRTHADNGLLGCYLTTDDFRVPALYTYLTIGYRPVLWTDDARERWENALRALGIPSVNAYRIDLSPAPDVTAE